MVCVGIFICNLGGFINDKNLGKKCRKFLCLVFMEL